MSQILNEVLAANERYAATFGGKAKLIIPPARHFAVLTCMDARLDPAKFAGLAEGDAHSSATPAPRQRGCHSVPGRMASSLARRRRGCHSVPGRFLQTAPNPRMVS